MLFIDPGSVAASRRGGTAGAGRGAAHRPLLWGRPSELKRLRTAAALTAGLGPECQAVDGLTCTNVTPVAASAQVRQRNRGHFLIGQRVLDGLPEVVPEMPHPRSGAGERNMIHVLAIITAKPGLRDTVLEAFRANVPAVHAEDGCIEYGAAIDAEGFSGGFGDDSFVVIEKWASPEALRAHAASPHMAAYGAKTREWVAGRVIHVLAPT